MSEIVEERNNDLGFLCVAPLLVFSSSLCVLHTELVCARFGPTVGGRLSIDIPFWHLGCMDLRYTVVDCFSVLPAVEAIVTGVSSTRIQVLTGVTGLPRESQGHLQLLSVAESRVKVPFSGCDSKESLFSLVYRVLSALCTKETLPKFSESSCA